jgi:hypothetical protein
MFTSKLARKSIDATVATVHNKIYSNIIHQKMYVHREQHFIFPFQEQNLFL